MAYVRVASGYQPGGPNLALPGIPPSVGADKLTNYEVGLKSLLDNRRLQLDVAAFRIDRKDIQVLANNGVVSYLVNGGTASSTGFELATLYTPLDDLRLGLNVAYTDAKLTEDVPGISGLSGDRLPYAPRWSGSATADYTFLRRADWTARAGGGVRYTGSRVTEVSHSPTSLPLKSYAVLDLNAELSNSRWTLRLFARNVTNRVVYINEFPAIDGTTQTIAEVHGVLLQPRVVDFEAGAAEILSPDAPALHWDVIEGQGSLFHPAYAAVSLGLLHGSQPDVIVLCHEAGRQSVIGHPEYALPSLEETIDLNLRLGRRTNSAIRCAGVCLNTSRLTPQAARELLAQESRRLGLPVADPMRGGAEFRQLVDACLA